MIEDRGFPGASAHRESLRGSRRDAALWRQGADGEVVVGRMLADVAEAGVRAVHDRRVPGSQANIDHIAVAPSGVYVIDAKNYRGHPRVDTVGGDAAPVPKLYVGTEDRTELVYAMRRQVSVVVVALDDARIPVRGVLCFIGAGWESRSGYLVAGVGVTSPERLADLLVTPGPLGEREIARIAGRLATALEPA